MANTPLIQVVDQLRRSVQAQSGLTDGELLEAYLTRRDEAAFECLIWRHGPAVLGACRRILQNEIDAEDAFQATFLVLIRKAATVRPRGAVGAWLYGVACHVARKSRATAAVRRAREMSSGLPIPREPADPDLRSAIDFEINRLPEKYRAPIVLCELQEQSIADAARQLGWPQGTLASRLSRGRAVLGKRLARQGLGLSCLVGASLTAEQVAGVLRATHESSGVGGALATTVVHEMFVTKSRAIAFLATCATLIAIAAGALQLTSGRRGDSPRPADSPKVIRADASKKDEPAIAWGQEKDGVQFGLAFGKGQSRKIYIGERARFRVFARNTSDQPVAVGALQVLHLPMFAEPMIESTSDAKGLAVKVIRGPRVNPTTPHIKIDPKQTIELAGEFVLPFLPHRAEGETHVIAKAGTWMLAIPKLDTWTAGAGWGTGKLEIEIVPGDMPHTDSQRIAWGPVAEGLQFGLRPDKEQYVLGDTVKLSVQARNMSDAEIEFTFPTLSGWWPNNGRPIVRDAEGKDLKPHLAEPPGPIGPQAATPHKLKSGETAEVTVVSWIFVQMALPGLYKVDYVELKKPGEYTLQYPDLHAKNKPAWPTGAAKLTFSAPAKKDTPAKSGAERIVERWSIAGETIAGKPVTDGQFRVFEFRPQPGQGLMIAQDARGKEDWFSWTIDPKQSPKAIDLWARVEGASNPNHGIYEFVDGRLRIGLGAKFQYAGDPGRHTRPATFAAAAHVIELQPDPIAWGPEKDGLRFGLVLGSGQSKSVRLGDSIRFQLYVRNTTSTAAEFDARKIETLPAYAGVRASRGDKVLKTVTARPPGGLPRPDRFSVPARTVQTVGQFVVPVLATENRNVGAHVVGEVGTWDVDIPDLNGWLTRSGDSTGSVEIELRR